MTSRLFALLLTLFACTCALAQGPADEEMAAKVDAYLTPFVETRNFSGSILIARRGKVLMARSYGMANYELSVPNTPQTKFQIASLSKPFTAAAILQLEAQGKLNLNDPLVRYIPGYPNGEKITIHHLLAHRSGIPNVNSLPEYEEKSRFPQSLGQIIILFKDRPLDFPPGERYSYSNSNYNLLAYIIQKVSGEDYGEYLRKNIFEPAGMKDSGQPRAGELLSNRASGYVPRGMTDLENAPYLDWSIKTGNGSLYSTVEDLYRFDRALYTDKVLNRRSRDKMFSEQSEGLGYGWFVRKRFDRRVTAYGGRSPGFSSSMERYVDDDVCIIMAGNLYSSLAQSLTDDLAAIVFGQPYRTLQLLPQPVAPAVLAAAVGGYQFGPEFFTPNLPVQVAVRDGQLVLKSPEDIFLIPQPDGTFLDRAYGGTVTFKSDAQGTVTHFTWSFGREYVAQRLP